MAVKSIPGNFSHPTLEHRPIAPGTEPVHAAGFLQDLPVAPWVIAGGVVLGGVWWAYNRNLDRQGASAQRGPLWSTHEQQGDVEIDRHNNRAAARAYQGALERLIGSRDMDMWLGARSVRPEDPLPYADDVERLRDKLAAAMVGIPDADRASGVMTSQLALLGHARWGGVMNTLIATTTIPYLETLVLALRDIDDVARGNHPASPLFALGLPPDETMRVVRGEQVHLLEIIAAKQVMALGDTPSAESLEQVADVFERLSAILGRQVQDWRDRTGMVESERNTRLTGLRSAAVVATETAIRYHLDAIEKLQSVEWGTKPLFWRVAVLTASLPTEVQGGASGEVLRALYRDSSLTEGEAQDLAALLLTDVEFSDPVALDAATYYFTVHQDDAARDSLKGLFPEDSRIAQAFDLMTVGRQHLEVDPVQAALDMVGREIDRRERTPGFDWLEVQIAKYVDRALRTAIAMDPAAQHPYLPRAQSLSERVPSDVRLNAALAEVILCKGDAPLALDRAVALLQAGALKDDDPMEIRQVLRGEVVEGRVADAVGDIIPRHLKRDWAAFKSAAAEKAGARAEEGRTDRDRDPAEVRDAVAP